jgi:hypothetical protein
LQLGQLHLSHCPELRVNPLVDAQGTPWLLLGVAIDVSRGQLVSQENGYCRLDASTDRVRTLVRNWSGRWLLLSANAIICDAAALLGVFYVGAGADFFASSSSALVGAHCQNDLLDTRIPGWHGLDWFPPPLTKYRNVYKLLPDQTLDPATGKVSFFDRLRSSTNCVQKSLDEMVESTRVGLISAVRALTAGASAGRITLPLTAGLDSRTTLALLVHAGLDFDVCTFLHSRISRADVELPPLLAARFGIRHEFIQSAAPDTFKAAVFDEHTDDSVHGADRESFVAGCFHHLSGRRWYLRSGCWELGRRYFHRKLPESDLSAVVSNPKRLAHAFNTYVNVGASAQGIGEWARWRLASPVDVDWRDLFYRDQRLGGWLSAIEQSLDLTDPTSLHLVNCDFFYEMLLAASAAVPEPAALQHALIGRCCPALSEYPVNPDRGGWIEKLNGVLAKASIVLGGEFRSLARMCIPRSSVRRDA